MLLHLEVTEAGMRSPTCPSPPTVTLETTVDMAEPPSVKTLDPWVTAWTGAALVHHLTCPGIYKRKKYTLLCSSH